MNQMTIPIFDPTYQKIIEIIFSVSKFALACKKSVHYMSSFLSQFYTPMTKLATPISDHAHPNIFWLTFNLCGFVSTWKKSGYFSDLIWNIWLIKKPCNLIGWEHFGLYLRIQNFPKYTICAGMQQII